MEPPGTPADDLRAERFVGMRSGYLMHRFAHRLFGPELPAEWHYADGAEVGKMMVAEGIGVAVLPDYSVHSDPNHAESPATAVPPDTGCYS